MGLAKVLPQTDERRGEDRPLLGRSAALRFDDGVTTAPAEAMLADLTRDGCRVQTDAALPRDAEIDIEIPNIGWQHARVLWHGPAGYGCAFTVPLPSGAVTAAFGRSNVVAFPLDRVGIRSFPATAPAKLAPRLRLLIPITISVALWGILATGAAILLR